MASDADFNKLAIEVRRMGEVVRTLNGEAAKEKRAVLLKQFAQLKSLPAEAKAKPVTSAPTANDFNLLLNDVRALYAAINLVSNALS